jgi:broad specificity phosphatase PhoE
MIYFVRHGRKEKSETYDHYYNETLRIMDEPLSDKGKDDAERIAAYFKDITVKKIIVSQYKRTYETAVPTAEDKGIPVTIDARVNEINNGVLRNMTVEEVAAKYPELWRELMSGDRDVRFPGGDSGADVKKRQDSFLSEMKSEKDDILVVSHDGFIRLLMCNILGLPVYKRYRFKTNMGGISAVQYDYEDNEWKIVRFNQVL